MATVTKSALIESRVGTREVGVPTHVYPYTAGIIGGLLGGILMALPALAYGFMTGYGPWLPINLIAATFLTPLQGMTPEQITAFEPLALGVGLSIHLGVATLLGLLFAMLLPTLPGRPALWSLVVGPLLWFGATLVLLPQINPIMSQLLDWPSFALANSVYGLVLGLWVASTPKVRAEQAYLPRLDWPSFTRK
jgi:hypothetical protein